MKPRNLRICYLASEYQSHARVAHDYQGIIAKRHTLVGDPQSADIVIIHIEPHDFATLYRDFPCLKTKFVIAYCVWETDKLPETYIRSLALVQEVWTCSEYCREVIAKYHHNVFKVPHIISRELEVLDVDRKKIRRLINFDPNCIYFLSVSMLWDSRKNTGFLVEAFQRLREKMPNARLIIKSEPHGGRCFPFKSTNPPIIWMNDKLSNREINAIYELAHVCVSTHHSEGWGLTLSDAMLFGKPIIATGYSGNMEYMNNENAFLLRFEEQPIKPEDCWLSFDESMKWAYADGDDLDEKLQYLYVNHAGKVALDKIKRAYENLSAFTAEEVGNVILNQLDR